MATSPTNVRFTPKSGHRWVSRNGRSLLHFATAFGPVLEAAEVVNALIAHVFENLAAERRTIAGAAIDDPVLILGKALIVRGRIRVGAKFQQAARDVHGASDLAALFHFEASRTSTIRVLPCAIMSRACAGVIRGTAAL